MTRHREELLAQAMEANAHGDWFAKRHGVDGACVSTQRGLISARGRRGGAFGHTREYPYHPTQPSICLDHRLECHTRLRRRDFLPSLHFLTSCKKLGCRACTNLLATVTDGLRPTNASKCCSSGSGGLGLRALNGVGASSSLFSCFVWSLLTSAFVASRTLPRRDPVCLSTQPLVSLGSESNSIG